MCKRKSRLRQTVFSPSDFSCSSFQAHARVLIYMALGTSLSILVLQPSILELVNTAVNIKRDSLPYFYLLLLGHLLPSVTR